MKHDDGKTFLVIFNGLAQLDTPYIIEFLHPMITEIFRK